MDLRRTLRGPIVWIVVAFAVIAIGITWITSAAGFRVISTQEGLDLLKGSTVQSAKIVDGEQRVDLTLTKADGDNGTKVQFYYVAPRGTEVFTAINDASLTNLDSFDDEVPQTSLLTSLLFGD